jgi:hypothetical protein
VTESDRRKAERLHLDPPAAGFIDDMPLVVLEVGLLGARIEHESPLLPNSVVALRFDWEEEQIEITSRVIRSDIQSLLSSVRGTMVCHSGLEFIDSTTSATTVLRQLISAQVTRRLERLKANARGDGPEPVTAEMIRDIPFVSHKPHIGGKGSDSVYLTFRFDPTGEWICNRAVRPKQPLDGFTVPATLGEREIAMLKAAYEKTTPEGRNRLRICAELSVTEGETVPPHRLIDS